jgi:hypothetical protein
VLAAACADGPLDPDERSLLLESAVPPVQLAAPLTPPPEALRVVVRRSSDLSPMQDVEVRWSAVAGPGLSIRASTTRTDSAGSAFAEVTLGAERGRYLVRARAGDVATDFELWAVDAPAVDSMPARARPGDTVRIYGRNFSPVPDHDVVRFGDVRAKVLRASATELRVEVPPCLPAASAAVRVSLGIQTSVMRSMRIDQGAPVEPLPVGSAALLDGAAQGAAACRRLPAGSYLLVLSSTSAVSGAHYTARLTTLASAAAAPLAPSEALVIRTDEHDPGSRWDATLRRMEAAWLRQLPTDPAVPPVARAIATPRIGDRREFSVLEPDGRFRRVDAVVRWVGARAAFYEDAETPPGQLAAADYAAFAASFDDPIAPTVTRIFGGPSDLDGNERIVVLFTPAVNRLTERNGTDGFIGGFFYGLDLLEGRAHSNGGEIFYVLVPDPEGRFGDPRKRELVLPAIPTILAHEFMHMVHFAERVVVRGARTGEALWLSEALAEMAEDRVGDAYAQRGQHDVAGEFHAGNRKRARTFLESPLGASLITAAGTGTLAERGASWLFLRYVVEQYGGDELLGRLTRTTRTGIENVTTATGRDWRALVLDWATAVYDGEEPGIVDPAVAGARHRYRVLRPRDALSAPGQPYPLAVTELGGGGATTDVSLLAGAVGYYRLDASAPVSIGVGGRTGAALPSNAGVVVRVLRLR